MSLSSKIKDLRERTIDNVARDTGIDREVVARVINAEDKLIKERFNTWFNEE